MDNHPNLLKTLKGPFKTTLITSLSPGNFFFVESRNPDLRVLLNPQWSSQEDLEHHQLPSVTAANGDWEPARLDGSLVAMATEIYDDGAAQLKLKEINKNSL